MHTTQEIHDVIASILQEKEISANKMLIECGLGKDTISKLKIGSMPSKDKLKKIADYLGVSYAYLCGVEEIKPNTLTTIKNAMWATPQRIASLNNGTNKNVEDVVLRNIGNFVGYSPDYLIGFDEENPIVPITDNSDDTFEEIIDILDRCAVGDKFKKVQIQLSRIIAKHLTDMGITQNDLHEKCGCYKAKLAFIFDNAKSIDSTVNFGFNISDLLKVREVYKLSLRDMLKGNKK